MRKLKESQEKLIVSLRSEAGEVKECFTRFSFQAIAFSGAALAFMIGREVQPAFPILAVGTFAIVSLLLAVARIGVHKYTTANRHYGYQLYLERARYMDDCERGWKFEMTQIGWEEALRAWRIVQATFYETVYKTTVYKTRFLRIKGFDLRKKLETPKGYRWFEPTKLVPTGTYYFAGSYLWTMLLILHTLAIVALVPAIYVLCKSWKQYGVWKVAGAEVGIMWIMVGAAVGWIFVRIAKDHRRRVILERELLSIHSCAIMWQAVVVSHYRAIESLRKKAELKGCINHDVLMSRLARRISKGGPVDQQQTDEDAEYHKALAAGEYTAELANQAKELQVNPLAIQDWIEGHF